MAEIERFVNTASDGGNGTTNGTGAGGNNAYAGLAIALSTESAVDHSGGNNLTIFVSDIDGGGTDLITVTTVFNDSNWATPPDLITVQNHVDEPVGAAWNSGFYIAELAGAFDWICKLDSGGASFDITFKNIQCLFDPGSATTSNMIDCPNNSALTSGKTLIIDGLLIDMQTQATCTAIECVDTGGTMIVINNVIFNAGKSSTTVGIKCSFSDNTKSLLVANNTITDCAIGISIGNGTTLNFDLYNNICVANTTDYSVGGVDNSAGNVSLDTSSPETGLREKTVIFADATSPAWDYQSSDTDIVGIGTNLSGGASSIASFDNDQIDVTRSAWDSGAYEDQAAGVTVPVMFKHYANMRA